MSEPTQQKQEVQAKEVSLSVPQALIGYRARADALLNDYSNIALRQDAHIAELNEEIARLQKENAELKTVVANLQTKTEQE